MYQSLRILAVFICMPLCSLTAGCPEEAAIVTDDLICCSKAEVFIIESTSEGMESPNHKWNWQASDSTEIPEAMQSRFVNVADCKPVGKFILVVSSSSGVAIIQRSDRKCIFHTFATNAHSACLLPQQHIAIASSYGGDEIVIYSYQDIATSNNPDARLELHGAHGVYWDKQRSRLWGLGDSKLILVAITDTDNRMSLAVEKEWNLPTKGGHDLSPAQDGKSLFVTTDTQVYRFEMTEGLFKLDEDLGLKLKVKSVDQHPLSGEIVYQQAGESWWGETVRFVGSDQTIEVPGERFYKFRWDAPAELPEAELIKKNTRLPRKE